MLQQAAGCFGGDAPSPRRTAQDVAQSDFVRRSRPGTKLAQLGPAVDNAGSLILNRPIAEVATPQVQGNDCLGGPSGLFQRAGAVQQESADFRIGVKMGEPIHILEDPRTEEWARGLRVDAAFSPPGFLKLHTQVYSPF